MFFINIIKKQNKLLIFHVIVIILFSIINFLVSKKYGNNEDKENFKNYSDTFYYTTITHFTIGFGDISPRSRTMKMISVLHAFVAFSLMNL